MLGQFTYLLLAALLVLALATGQAAVFVLALGILLADGVSRAWDRLSLSRVEYRRSLSQRRAFFGERVEVAVEIANRKLLPLAWLRAEDEWPELLPLEPGPVAGRFVPCHKPRRVTLRNLVSLRWYQRLRRRYTLRCTARGEFAFGPARLSSGDVFGLFERDLEVDELDRLLVYPRVVPLARLGLASIQPFGDFRARQKLVRDPAWLLGLRDYLPGDDPRHVDWKASARAQAMQVKLFDATTSYRLQLFLNLNTYGEFWWWQGFDRDLLEMSVMVTASLAAWALGEGFEVGLAANGNARQADRLVGLPAARDPAQITRVLEALARVLPFATMPFEELLRVASRGLPWGATAVVITSVATPQVLEAVRGLGRTGREVALVLVGSRLPQVSLPGVSVHHVRREAAWSALTELEI